MKKRIIAFSLALVMVLGAALAVGGTKTLSVIPMKMTINGEAVTPTKADGTPAEVFSYDGATYVPLRYLSELLGIEVDWDENEPDTAKLVGENLKPGKLNPGTYTATAPGRAGQVTVAVTVNKNSILAVDVIENTDTDTVKDAPARQMPADMVKYQTIAVDSVAGATLTSAAIRMAARNALKQAADDISDFTKPAAYPAEVAEDATCDVVVVGAGAAGMIAAIKATEGGANVILIEKQGLFGGGDAMFASSGMSAGGGAARAEIEGATDEDYLASLLATAEKKNIAVDVPSMTAYALRGGYALDWYISIGVPFGAPGKTGFSNKMADGSAPGAQIIRCLGEKVESMGIDARLNTRATSIVMDDGKAVGVTVKTKAGSEYTIHANAVLLSCGGYAANNDLLEQYAPQWLGLPSTGSISATGDGILMAQAIGADLWNMEQTKANWVCHVADNGATVSLAAIQNSIVVVNKEGKRFLQESNSSINAKSAAELEQTDKMAYAIFDSSMMNSNALIRGYNELGYFLTGETFEELAAQMDVDQDAFLQTMENYRKYCTEGTDPEFNTSLKETLEDAPYYAVTITPSIQSTYGGVHTDEAAHVVDTNGDIIPGLYAAGAVSGHGCFGNEVGNGLTIATTFGHISADTILAELDK